MHDVVIAGAGPVGLFLACELRLAGASVLVVEQAEDPRSPLKRPPFGIRGLSAPTLEALYRRGLLDEIAAPLDISIGAHWRGQPRRAAGHFAGIQFFQDDIDRTKWTYRLPGPIEPPFAVDMERIETVLTARAAALGADIRRGRAVEALEVSDNGVLVRSGQESFAGRWLVGCDGGRSIVRKTAGFDFTGSDPEFTGYSVEVELADPEKLRPGRHYTPTGMYTYTAPGAIAMADFDGGAFHRTQPVTLDHVQTVLRRISGTDVNLTALLVAATWTDRAFQASDYRRGRVLLAGDAAHIHSPLGGQGLNLGLGDAMNLGWKLAATIRGDAPPGLLDSYAAERHPIGARILDWSRAQVAILRPSPSSRALEAIMRDLVETRDGATYFAERVWGVSLNYDLGGGHPLVGRSAPDFELADGRRLGEILRTGKGVFLDFEGRFPLENDRITSVACDAKDQLGLSAVLVRPDGFVAWASDGMVNLAEAVVAAKRWFG